MSSGHERQLCALYETLLCRLLRHRKGSRAVLDLTHRRDHNTAHMRWAVWRELHEIHGYPQHEIARMAGYSYPTVCRGLGKLKARESKKGAPAC